MPWIGWPPESHRASPRATLRVARVTMNGCGRRPYTNAVPLMAPTSVPVTSMATITHVPDGVDSKTSAPTTADRASVEPTDRSMPRVMMTSSWASASTAMTADWLSTLPTLRVLRNTGDSDATTSTTTSSMRPGPMRIAARARRGPSKPARAGARRPRGVANTVRPVARTIPPGEGDGVGSFGHVGGTSLSGQVSAV